MSRILMVTWDGGGNVPPALHIGRELLKRGHEVTVLGHDAQQEAIEAAGPAFVRYRQARPFSRVGPYADLSAFLETFIDAGAGRDLVELADDWSPDVAVVDCVMLGPLQAAQAAGLPTVVLIHSFWAYFGERFTQGPVSAMGAPHGRSPLQLWPAARTVLVASDRALDPVQGTIPPNVRWTGVAQPQPTPVARPDRNRVLLSLSTVSFPGQQESMQRILDALGELPVKVTATIDRSIDADRLRIPRNVDACGFVDHGELMPEVSLVIGHGGHATTMYALAHDLPLLVIPQHEMLDQALIGQVLAERGAAVMLDQQPEVADLQAAIMGLLQDDEPARAAARIGARLRETNGSGDAADAIEVAANVGVAT